MELKKLISLGLVVGTLSSFTFAFNSYQSKDGLIRKAVDNLKQVALEYKADYNELKSQYDEMVANLESTENALAQARLKLEQIYMKITGNAWDSASEDILEFDFDSIIPDGEQFDNNVDGNAIAELLGLEAGATTSEILVAIQNLIDTVSTLEQRITALESQIATYEEEQNYLVDQLMELQTKLENAQAEANAIIDGASEEEQEQLDYINGVLEELEGDVVEDNTEGEDGEVVTYSQIEIELAKIFKDSTVITEILSVTPQYTYNDTVYDYMIETNGRSNNAVVSLNSKGYTTSKITGAEGNFCMNVLDGQTITKDHLNELLQKSHEELNAMLSK